MNTKAKGLVYPSVKFQRASANLETFTATRKNDKISHGQDGGCLSGTEAKEFYESLMKESDETPSKRKLSDGKSQDRAEGSMKKHSKVKKVCLKYAPQVKTDKNFVANSRLQNLFLKMAQDGDVDGLQGVIRDNKVDINAADQFGWTALMCAARSGRTSCIQLLLNAGAEVSLQNNTGQTAVDIAKESGIEDAFHTRKSRRCRRKYDCGSKTVSTEQTCDVCGSRFSGSRHKHDSSTAHLFNCQYKSEQTIYHIPEDNIGFKLLKQKGWDKEKGLGPEGTGRKYPIKTVLKQDRLGLGSKTKEKAKITHFSARDTSAVESTKNGKASKVSRVPRRTWKRKLIQNQEKERKWEHDLRVYMNTE